MFHDGQILASDQIKQLQSEGHSLDEKKLYVIRFLFNDKWNRATQPGPFRIKTELVDKLAKDAIGTPWIILPEPYTDQHPVGASAQELAQITKKYAVGYIKSTLKYPSGNVFGIIEIFPQYEEMIKKNEIPPLVSPLFNVIQEDKEGISDAQFVNLQSVNRSGYPAQLTRITSFCKNGLKECIAELSLAGAAGKETSSDTNKNFSISAGNIDRTMSAPQITLESVAKTVEDHGRAIAELTDSVNRISTDVATIKTTLEGKQTDVNPKGAAGEDTAQVQIPKELLQHPAIKQLAEEFEATKKSLEEIKKEREEEKKKLAEQKRKAAAESIVTLLIKHKKLDEKNKDKEIKKYLELKNEDGSLQDLDGIEATLKSVLGTEPETPTVKGAYGVYTIPDLKGSKDRTNAEMLGVI
jgi:hypothetical protein